MIKFGPAGNDKSFYESGYKSTVQAPAWLNALGLDAFEYSFGRGVNLREETGRAIGTEMAKYNIQISVHAPYYINFAAMDELKAESSYGYVLQSLNALNYLGGIRAVVHVGHQGAASRKETLNVLSKRLEILAEKIHAAGHGDKLVCFETMGKKTQIGTVEEILALCTLSDNFYPCFDFGHINCYTQGGLKTADDFKRVFDLSFEVLGDKKTHNCHIHFSKVMYGAAGELKHLDFNDSYFGPRFEPLAEVLAQLKLEPVVICESAEIMAQDALVMKKIYNNTVFSK